MVALVQPNFPGARPLLHRLLPLNRVGNLIVKFDIHEPRDAIPFDEARPETLSVLPDAARDVIGDANVERPMLAVGKDVNAVGHRLAPMPMGPGDKPRDDSGMYSLKTKKPVPRFGGRSAAPFRKIPGGGSARAGLRLDAQPSGAPRGPPRA